MEFGEFQIRLMRDSVDDWRVNKKDSMIWKEAFRAYNENNKPTLSMFCTSCYPKVLKYIIANNSKETVNIEL